VFALYSPRPAHAKGKAERDGWMWRRTRDVKGPSEMSDYYVYVYIDPRNFEPFYYGKGEGARKEEHAKSKAESRKANRIKQIIAAGAEPIVKVIAKGLTEEQAYLVETTLIWQAEGRTLNEAAGPFSKHFRPHRTLHLTLPDFDRRHQLYFFNVGESKNRKWENSVKYGYVGAGHGKVYSRAIRGLQEGDIIAAYLSKNGRGYVGVGRVTATAKPAREFGVNGKLLLDCSDIPEGLGGHLNDDDMCEWMAAVKWIKTVGRNMAHFKEKAKLYTPQLVRASLAKQPKTIKFINERFGVDLYELANEDRL